MNTTSRATAPNPPRARGRATTTRSTRPGSTSRARNLVGFALFVVLAIVALYFLLPQVAGLEETWHRLEDGSPVWLGLALLFTVGMFGGYVLLFQRRLRARRPRAA